MPVQVYSKRSVRAGSKVCIKLVRLDNFPAIVGYEVNGRNLDEELIEVIVLVDRQVFLKHAIMEVPLQSLGLETLDKVFEVQETEEVTGKIETVSGGRVYQNKQVPQIKKESKVLLWNKDKTLFNLDGSKEPEALGIKDVLGLINNKDNGKIFLLSGGSKVSLSILKQGNLYVGKKFPLGLIISIAALSGALFYILKDIFNFLDKKSFEKLVVWFFASSPPPQATQ